MGETLAFVVHVKCTAHYHLVYVPTYPPPDMLDLLGRDYLKGDSHPAR